MVLTLYRDQTFWILYRDEGQLLRVYNIGRTGPTRLACLPTLPSVPE